MRIRSLLLTTVITVLTTTNQTSVAQSTTENDVQGTAVSANAETVFEIRSYHFKPALISDYRNWVADEALPYISQRIDVVGFWVASSDPPEIEGAPLDELGSANVTWIIRWPSIEHRQKGIAAVFSGPEWEDIFSRVPGGVSSYLRVESRFAKAVP